MAIDLDQTLAALADPTRRAIVELLRDHPQRPSEVAQELAMSRPALSRHLRVLRNAGLVHEELVQGDARARLLQLRREPIAQLRGWAAQVEGFWTEQLEAFKTHAEQIAKERRR